MRIDSSGRLRMKEKGAMSEEYYRVDVGTPFVYLLFTSVLAFWPFMM